ncbi:MAG: TonB family protein [Acidobacteria bacterium]|nr:TonB family protein [Acidobacteriota bacterium]
MDLRGPLGPGSTGPIDLGAEAEAADTRRFRRAIFGAAALHLLLLGATFPEWTRPLPAAPARSTILVRTVRFRAPESRPAERIPPRKAKRIPIPDPTPADPEPMEVADRPIPDLDLDLDPLGLEAFAIPDAPPGRTGPAPVHLGEGILPPRKVFAPRPRYAEEARQARLQGVVVLMAVIDEKGEVAEIEVLKGLGLGLTESAVETVRGWKFEPATRAGEPVAVYMNLVVSFRLQ